MRVLCFGLVVVFFLRLPSIAQDGFAALNGKVTDDTGVGVPGTEVEISSDAESTRKFRTSTDSTGVYHLSGVPADEYTLHLFSPGFASLTVKSIHILRSEQRLLPTLRLHVASVGDCSDHAVLQYLRLLPSDVHFGNLGGSIKLDQGPMAGNGPPMAGANVTLVCSTGKTCGATKTNANGEFVFKNLPPGNLSVRARSKGFYPLSKPGYEIEEGLESVYWSIYLEQCPLGNCDPTVRPKKPPAVCE
jgi:hypothetical protein